MKRIKKKKSNGLIQIKASELERIKRHITYDITKKTMMVVICSVVDTLNIDHDKVIELCQRVDCYSSALDDTKLLRMRDFANEIFEKTGIDWRGW